MTGTRPKAGARFSVVGLDFFWIWGLGLPLRPPVALSDVMASNQSKRLDTLAWVVRVVLPLVGT